MDNVSSRGVVGSDPQNTADPKGVHTRSTFNEDALGYRFYATLPFGEIRPFTFFESVPDDKKIRAQFISQVYSYTLKAPLMQGIHMKKLLAQVPREAILPLNWNKWFKNPVIGQDVPGDVGTSVLGFWNYVYRAMLKLKQGIPNDTINTVAKANTYLDKWFKYLVIGEMFFSDGNLLKHSSISGSPWAFSLQSDNHTHNNWDYVFDRFVNRFSALVQGGFEFQLKYGTSDAWHVKIGIDPNKTYPGRWISLREALSMMRDDLTFSIDTTGITLSVLESFRQTNTNDAELNVQFMDDVQDEEERAPIDLKRLWAYQLVCAHFLTNDSVDFVYTAELFRQYVWSLICAVAQDEGDPLVDYFNVNGMSYQYDHLSAKYFAYIMNDIITNGFDASDSSLAYLCALFSFKRSLRYLDYFTGAKTRPLAVGDVTVEVNNNRVNVVDTQAKTFLARFLNVINRVGMRNYLEGVFNTRQAPDWHNPQYLVKIDDIVAGDRVENTGDAQWEKPNSVTSLLRGNSDRFAFEMDFDRSSVIIGLVWFDVDRVYSMATERQNLHYDRFDEFQPFMQYTGDQALYRLELGSPLTNSVGSLHPMDAFGYKLRNAEYKERFDQCAGGFCNDMLDGYLFKADVLESSSIVNVGPSFIRSFPSELDRFYLSLTGYSLGTYFHFIVKFENLYSGSRPMAYAPTLM